MKLRKRRHGKCRLRERLLLLTVKGWMLRSRLPFPNAKHLGRFRNPTKDVRRILTGSFPSPIKGVNRTIASNFLSLIKDVHLIVTRGFRSPINGHRILTSSFPNLPAGLLSLGGRIGGIGRLLLDRYATMRSQISGVAVQRSQITYRVIMPHSSRNQDDHVNLSLRNGIGMALGSALDVAN